MRKQFSVKLADGTSSIIRCEEEQLEEILKDHYSGLQLRTAIVTEIPQVAQVAKKVTYRTMEGFMSEIDESNILEMIDFESGELDSYKGWDFETTRDAILAIPSAAWIDKTPILITTVGDLIELLEIIDRIHA